MNIILKTYKAVIGDFYRALIGDLAVIGAITDHLHV